MGVQVSALTSWGEAPRESPWGRRRRRWEDASIDDSAHERAALDHAEKVERFLVARITAYEEAGRAVPERMLENLENMRGRIEWLASRIEEIKDDG
jgi:hypothetical protein